MKSYFGTLFYNMFFIPVLAVSVVLFNSLMIVSTAMNKCFAFFVHHKRSPGQEFLYKQETDKGISWDDVRKIDRNAVSMVSESSEKHTRPEEPEEFEKENSGNHPVPNLF